MRHQGLTYGTKSSRGWTLVMARVHRQTSRGFSAHSPPSNRGVRGSAQRYLCHFLKVFVPFLEGPRSVEGLPHACVLAEEGLTVVLDPVQHLRAKITEKRDDAEPQAACVTVRRASVVLHAALPATSSFKGLNK